MRKYDVWLRSKPGMWVLYNGKVTVNAKNSGEAIDRAKTRLKQTSFPDRGIDAWIVEKVEIVG